MDAPGNRASNHRLVAEQVLTDCEEYHLGPEALDAWERINQRPARSLKGLRALIHRPSPFQA